MSSLKGQDNMDGRGNAALANKISNKRRHKVTFVHRDDLEYAGWQEQASGERWSANNKILSSEELYHYSKLFYTQKPNGSSSAWEIEVSNGHIATA